MSQTFAPCDARVRRLYGVALSVLRTARGLVRRHRTPQFQAGLANEGLDVRSSNWPGYTRVGVFAVMVVVVAIPLAVSAAPQSSDDLKARFEYLSKNGNSNCSREFVEAIPSMPPEARLQGSCCSPMDFHRYGEQVEGLKRIASIDLIPPDPYDIPAPQAARLIGFYGLDLSPAQQNAYDYAMQHSNEGGPCCCQCWRWSAYGGLAKYLIREHGFSGEQIARLWDLSDGCGGTRHAH